VTKESATWSVPNESFHDQIPIDTDHSAMVKYSNRMDGNYLTVANMLKICVQGVSFADSGKQMARKWQPEIYNFLYCVFLCG
jgi:hypothetical protein